MEILTANDGTKLVSFADAKDVVTHLIKHFTEISQQPDELILRYNALMPLHAEMVNTLICVMYSGRHMLDGTAGEIGDTPDEEILLEEAEIGPLIRTDSENERDAIVNLLKNAECTASYMQKFLDHYSL